MPSSRIDLDTYMQGTGRVPDLYLILAKENDIGLYSYEYEMLQAETVYIENAEGLVAGYVTDGILDISAFETAWQAQQIKTKIDKIIHQHKLENTVQQHPSLKDAFLEVYKAGQLDSKSE